MQWQHPDESKKVKFIEQNTHDFHHPALMTQVPWLLNKIFRYGDKEKIAILGRTTTAVYGTLIALFVYLLIRPISGKVLSLIVFASVAFSPILVMHAHYLKEDILFTCFAIFTLIFILQLAKKNNIISSLILGLSLGLAISSQYKAALLFLLILLIPLIIKIDRKGRYYLNVFVSFVISFFVFFGVNYLIFKDFATFWSGFSTSTNHMIVGHVLKIYPLPHFFAWHFIHSIIPGISLPLALLALGMMIYSLIKWKTLPDLERLILVYAFIYYFAVETSPLKAFPDFSRYVIPETPIFIYFACKAGWLIVQKAKNKIIFWPALLAYMAVLLFPIYDSVNLVYYLKRDTRQEARKWINNCKDKLMVEKYVYFYRIIDSLANQSIEQWQAHGYKYLVASSFTYDRYIYGGTLKNQDKNIYVKAERYKRLFNEYPYEEIRPKYKSFAFSNPTIRIVDIRPSSKKRKM